MAAEASGDDLTPPESPAMVLCPWHHHLLKACGLGAWDSRTLAVRGIGATQGFRARVGSFGRFGHLRNKSSSPMRVTVFLAGDLGLSNREALPRSASCLSSC